MTPQEFYSAVEWEGGLCEAVFSYGLGPDDLDDSDPELKEAIRAMKGVEPVIDRARELLNKHDPFLEDE
ncbi:hypothetical protein FDH96_gp142 [Mycobacterium phage Rey]|uniref:Uncharacterized protein n=1 Tax=Mycobacterium phage Rey TaxID=1034115 RepID=G1D5H7_9CAUD|nr:hypothetical protein FDH96_gp142 [Mycobacterium phage Rey]AEK10025.1 hypothetical protein PBI_REY_137 [Mycobacterium phage Rey]